jgi:hypothetical protein
MSKYNTCPALTPTYTDEIYAKVHDCPVKEENERMWQFVLAADDIWAWLELNGNLVGLPTKGRHKYEIMRQRIMKSQNARNQGQLPRKGTDE